jgi:hypothetical protein
LIKQEEIASLLRENVDNPTPDFWEMARAETKDALLRAQGSDDTEASDQAWFLNKVATTRGLYIHCFRQIMQAKYYEAWCNFERVEIENRWLFSNAFYDIAEFKVDVLQTGNHLEADVVNKRDQFGD